MKFGFVGGAYEGVIVSGGHGCRIVVVAYFSWMGLRAAGPNGIEGLCSGKWKIRECRFFLEMMYLRTGGISDITLTLALI